MDSKNALDVWVAVAQLATPILLAGLGAFGWYLQHSMERRSRLEEKLREDRIEIYNKLLEPYMILLMSDAMWAAQDHKQKNQSKDAVALKIMFSLDYRKVSLQLALMGSDGAVLALNELMQEAFRMGDSPQQSQGKIIISLLGTLLLEIRKSMGNESTKVDNIGMVEWFLTDARNL